MLLQKAVLTQFALVFGFTTLHSFAQTGVGSLSGQVLDSAGGAVPKAAVSIRQDATGREQKTETSEAGLYAFPSLEVGEYTLSVELRGFKRLSGSHSSATRLIPSISRTLL